MLLMAFGNFLILWRPPSGRLEARAGPWPISFAGSQAARLLYYGRQAAGVILFRDDRGARDAPAREGSGRAALRLGADGLLRLQPRRRQSGAARLGAADAATAPSHGHAECGFGRTRRTRASRLAHAARPRRSRPRRLAGA